MFEEAKDLTATNLRLQSQARDVERCRAIVENTLEGHQLEEELKKKDFRFERAQEMTTALRFKYKLLRVPVLKYV